MCVYVFSGTFRIWLVCHHLPFTILRGKGALSYSKYFILKGELGEKHIIGLYESS